MSGKQAGAARAVGDPFSKEMVDSLIAPIDAQLGHSKTFLRRYARWAVTQTDAPTTFHVLTGLIGLATTLPANVTIELGTGTQAPNLFGMIVGESGRARKSWSMSLIRGLLDKACPTRLGLRIGSYEAAVAAVAEQPYMTVFEPEFSRFLSQAKGGNGGGGYMDAVKTGLTDLYDCSPVSRKTMKGSWDVRNYRINLIGAISDDYLSDYTTPSDFTGGFLSRWLFASGDRTRFLAEPDASPAARTEKGELVDLLQTMYDHAPSGVFILDTASHAMFLDWTYEMDALGAKADRRLVGMIERAAALGKRLATILAMDRIVNRDGYRAPASSRDPFAQALAGKEKVLDDSRWQITLEDLEPAMHIVAAHLVAAQRIVAKVEHTPAARAKAKVLYAMPTGIAVPLGHLTKETGLRKREVEEILQTLALEDRAAAVAMNGSNWYARAKESVVRTHSALPLPTVQRGPEAAPPIPSGWWVEVIDTTKKPVAKVDDGAPVVVPEGWDD